MDPDNLLGLPGLLCTVSSSRVRGHETADIPVHVYGPEGLAEFIAGMFKVRFYWDGVVAETRLPKHSLTLESSQLRAAIHIVAIFRTKLTMP